MNDLVFADTVSRLQCELLKLPQIEPQTKHFFADGMYAREVFRKAGTLIVGKVHRKEHFFVLTAGDMSVWTERGMQRAKAPFIWISPVGTKRVTFAHEDSTAMTVHQVSSKDIEEIERELVEEDLSSAYGPGNTLMNPLLESA